MANYTMHYAPHVEYGHRTTSGGIIRNERITKAVGNGNITLTLNPEKQNRSKKIEKNQKQHLTFPPKCGKIMERPFIKAICFLTR